jgi:hypothetical protein
VNGPQFEDRGERQLKGIEAWRLFAVAGERTPHL